jgi:hypothetical protein
MTAKPEKDPVRSERAKKAWETRRANAAKRVEEAKETPQVVVAQETPAVADAPASSPVGAELPPPPPRPDAPVAAEKLDASVPEPKPIIPNHDPATAKNEVVQIHILNDGFTAFAKTWYRGETISVERGSDEWNQTVDKNGNSWLDMTIAEQLDRYDNVQQFGFGPWPYEPPMSDEEYEKAIIAAQSPEEERRIQKKRQREKAAPLPVTTGA